jgi:hypothetical protein
MRNRSLGVPVYKSVFAITLLAFFISISGVSLAQDIDALAKEANSKLRAAQNKMFRGKHQEALSILSEVSALLNEIKTAAPESSKLKTLEPKYAKLKKDIERRLPKEKVVPEEKKDGPADDQESELAALAKEADKKLGSAQRNFFNSKYDEANAQLLKVSDLIKKISALDSGYSKLATLNSKYNKLISDIEKRTGKASEAKPVQASSGTKTDQDKLPAAVTKRLKDIRSNIASTERYFKEAETVTKAENNLKYCQYAMKTIAVIMEEIQGGTPDAFEAKMVPFIMIGMKGHLQIA